MTLGVALLNFGEPAEPERGAVVDYLTRIFLANQDLEDHEDPEARARELAERRAGPLIEEYEEIGGSPLQAQARRQAELLEAELRDRGHDATTYVGMQFTEPFVADAAEAAREDDVDRLVGLPVYPLCGPSTTVQALAELSETVDDLVAGDDPTGTDRDAGWDVEYSELTGWHRHPGYTRARADNVRDFLRTRGVDVGPGGDATLVFSAHGTPTHYLERGSRYEQYVEEYCETLAASLGVDDYELGYQNHENRDVDWTEPDVEDVIEALDADHAVVEPVSFVHEQSETLSELDVELREEAEDAGVALHRVPIPHDDERFVDALADLVEPFAAGFDPDYYRLEPCQCRDGPATYCLNAPHSG